jgi:hypothetical protein
MIVMREASATADYACACAEGTHPEGLSCVSSECADDGDACTSEQVGEQGACVHTPILSDACLPACAELPGEAACPAMIGELAVGPWRLVSRSDLSTLTVAGATLRGAPYGALPSQQFRLKSTDTGQHTLAVESTKECLTSVEDKVVVGPCTSHDALFTLEMLRVRTDDIPAVYRLHDQASRCVRPGEVNGPTLGACDEAAHLHIEAVGWGERTGLEEYDLKALLIVKAETDVADPLSQATISPDIVEAAQTSYVDRMGTWMERMTDGRVKWNAEAVVSPDPLSSFTFEGGNYLPAAANVQEDVQRYLPIGKYDTAAVFFTSGAVPGGWVWGPGSSAASNYTLWVTINGGTTPAEQWTSWETEPTEAFIHGTMLDLDGFFSRFQVTLPDGGLQSPDAHHYARSALFGWLPWYRDYLLARVIESDGTYRGYGPRAFRLGTPRADALRR